MGLSARISRVRARSTRCTRCRLRRVSRVSSIAIRACMRVRMHLRGQGCNQRAQSLCLDSAASPARGQRGRRGEETRLPDAVEVKDGHAGLGRDGRLHLAQIVHTLIDEEVLRMSAAARGLLTHLDSLPSLPVEA